MSYQATIDRGVLGGFVMRAAYWARLTDHEIAKLRHFVRTTDYTAFGQDVLDDVVLPDGHACYCPITGSGVTSCSDALYVYREFAQHFDGSLSAWAKDKSSTAVDRISRGCLEVV